MLVQYARSNKAASSLEFAIVAPVLLLFLFGIFYIGWAIYGINSAGHAIEQTGRALQINQKLNSSELNAIYKSKISVSGMTVDDLIMTKSAPQGGYTLATLKGPIWIRFIIPFMGPIEIDCTVFRQVPLIAT